MADYFIPLKTVVPLTEKFTGLPVIGPVIKTLIEHTGFSDYRETWNDTHNVLEGVIAVDGEVVIPLGSWSLVLGKASSITTFDFISASRRRSILEMALEEGVTSLIESPPPADEPDSPTKIFLMLDFLPKESRTVISGVSLHLRLPIEHAQQAELIKNGGGEVTGIRRVTPLKSVDIELPGVIITYDSEAGISIALPDDAVLTAPPMMIGDSDIGVVLKDFKVDFRDDKGIAEVLARPGYDETWKGIYIRELTLYGLNTLLPFLPAQFTGSNWICGSDGWSGALDLINPPPAADDKSFWALTRIGIEFDRGSLVRGTIGVTFRVGSLDTEHLSLGPDGNLEIDFTLRHNRALSGSEAWGFDIAVLTPSKKDKGLLTIDKEMLQLMEMALPILILTALSLNGTPDDSAGLIILLFTILAALQGSNTMVLESITLDALRFRYFTQLVSGTAVRFIDVVLDTQSKLSLNFDIPIVLTAKTAPDHPIGVDLRGLTLRWALHFDALPDAAKISLGGHAFAFIFEPEGGVTFDLSEQSIIEGSIFEFFRFGVGKWEEGLWFDVGARTTQRLSATAGGGGEVRLFYLANGDFDHARLQGISATVFVPEVIYCKADLGWGEQKRVAAKAMFIGNGSAKLTPPAPDDPLGPVRPYLQRSAWLVDAEVVVQTEPVEGVTALLVGIDVSFSPGLPLGSSGISFFGMLGLYAQHYKPNAQGDYMAWFAAESKNEVLGPPPKWIAAKDHWGFGIGAVIGSTPDLGRTWNAKVGILLEFPGPVLMIFGSANILKPKPAVGDGESAAFAAILVLDFHEHTLTLGIIVQYNIPEDGKILTLHVPAEIFVDFDDISGSFHLYLGQHMPLSRRITAKALGLFDISGYLMFDTKAIENLAGHDDIDVPPFAIALGGRAEWIKGLRSGRIKCFFHCGVEFNLAIGLPDPWLFYGMLRLDGGLTVKVFGFGFDFGVWAELNAIAPEPFRIKGSVGISINLPWPLPDIDASIDLTFVDDGGELPPPGTAAGALTILPQVENQPLVIEEGGSASQTVPIDAVMSLAFRFPIRNNAVAGNFNVSSTDLQTSYKTAKDQGYIFDLTDLRLDTSNGGAPSPIPATWRVEPTSAPGGEVSRMVLDLFSFKNSPTSRFLGTSAKYLDGTLPSWEPCKKNTKASTVCYTFEGEKAGPLGTRILKKSGHPNVSVFTLPPPPNAALLLSAFGVVTSTASVVNVDADPEPDGVNVPGTFGDALEVFPISASETLVFAFERAHHIRVIGVRNSRRAATVIARFYDGDKLVETVSGTSGSSVGEELEQIVFICTGWATRVELTESAPQTALIAGVQFVVPAFDIIITRICVTYESEELQAQQNATSNAAWSAFWSELLAQDAAASDALLLDPETTYTLSGRVAWTHLDGSGGDTQFFSYQFTTEAKNRPPRPLRKRDLHLAADQDRWEIETLPDDGTFAMYLLRPIVLRFSDPRVEAVYKKFAQKLVLRIIDDHGEDLFQTLAILKEKAKSLPEYEEQWQAFATGASCTPDGISSLWSSGVATFDTVLQRNREYKASLHAVPLSVTELAGAEWKSFPSVHDFKFRTSRWKNATEHAAAFVGHLRDELVESPDIAALVAAAGGAIATTTDDQILDAALFDQLGLPFRKPAAEPEVVVIWSGSGTSWSAIGLLVDSPEPLVRGAGSSLTVSTADGPVDLLHLNGRTGARSLLLFAAPAAPGTLMIRMADVFEAKDGSLATEFATISVPIPDTPSIFAEEPLP
ncbi:MAG: hypothetical protein JWO97_2912 [Acidobacteria bacterium]|nr:hypothetical protein [Acidobacteriota bacterium]